MADRGEPDFMDTVSDTEKGALVRRVREETNNTGLHQWPHNDLIERGYPPEDVQRFCVKDLGWQNLRRAMKGKNTHEKLAMLKYWWNTWYTPHAYETAVQVGNYLGALRRGGQLDDYNHIRRWR